MGQPYIGEIRIFAGNFAPAGWAFCDGSLLPISENEVLFQLIGTTYGGDGQETFALPNLSGRAPMHQSPEYIIGNQTGVEEVTLTVSQIPSHNHVLSASSEYGESNLPDGNVWAKSPLKQFSTDFATATKGNFPSNTIGIAGGSQPHNNMMPFLAMNFIISLYGIFPSQT